MSDLDAAGSSAPPGSKGKNKSLDFLVNKLKDTAGSSREASPEPHSKEQKGRSSRRKPTVTHKVVEDEERLDDSFQEDDSLLGAAALLGAGEPMDTVEGQVESVKTNGFAAAESADEQKPEETIDIDEDGNFIVPEGTVVVEPEAVEDKRPEFKGPEFSGRAGGSSSRANKSQSNDILDNLHCSACNRQINPNSLANVKRHPVLQVLLCKKCYNWYTSAELDQDSDGIDEQCRWCGEGGNLVCCDYCSNVFCKGCIKRNLGRAELKAITDSGPDDKWHCYVCDPKPLANLIQECTNIIEAVTKRKEKEKEQQKKHKPQQKTPSDGPDKAKKPKLSGPAQKSKENNVSSSKISSSMKANMPTVSNLLLNKQSTQQVVSPQAARGEIQIVQRQGNKNVVYTLPSGAAVVQQRVQPSHTPTNKLGLIPVQKVENTIYRLLAATQSMQLLTTSLKDAFKKTGEVVPPHGSQAQRDVAMQLSRAFTSFKKSLNDIDDYAHGRTPSKAVSVQQQQPSKVIHVSGQLVSQYKGPAPGAAQTSPSPGKSVLQPGASNMASEIIAKAASQLRNKPVATSTPVSKPSGPLRVKLPFKSPKRTSEDVICIEDNSDESPSPQKKGTHDGKKLKSKKAEVNGGKRETEGQSKPKEEEEKDKVKPGKDENKEDFIIEENVEEEGDDSKEEVKTEGNGDIKEEAKSKGKEEATHSQVEEQDGVKFESANTSNQEKEEDASADEQTGAVSDIEVENNVADSISDTEAADAAGNSDVVKKDKVCEDGIHCGTSDEECLDSILETVEPAAVSSKTRASRKGKDSLESQNKLKLKDISVKITKTKNENVTDSKSRSKTKTRGNKGTDKNDVEEEPSQNGFLDDQMPSCSKDSSGRRRSDRQGLRRTREDIEAQRQLHRELMEDSSDDDQQDDDDDAAESEGTDELDSDEDDSEDKKSSEEEYKPSKGESLEDISEQKKKKKRKGWQGRKKLTAKEASAKFNRVSKKAREKRKKLRAALAAKKEGEENESDENKDSSEGGDSDSETESKSDKGKGRGSEGEGESESDKAVRKSSSKKDKKPKKSDENSDDSIDFRVERHKSPRKIKTTAKRRKRDNKGASESEGDSSNAKEKKPKRKRQHSDSSHDSELEKDIKKLAKAPSLGKKKKTSEDEGTDGKKEIRKSKGKKVKKGKDEEDMSSLSSEDDEQESEEEESSKPKDNEEEPMSDEANDEAATEDANEKARKELLAGSSDSEDSGDSDLVLSADEEKKGAKSKKSGGKSKKKENKMQKKTPEDEDENEVEEEVEEEPGKRKKKKAKHKLLDVKLSSDSDSDVDSPKKGKNDGKKRKKRKLRDSDEGSEKGESDEESEDAKDSEENSVDSNISDDEEFKSKKKGKGKGKKRRRLKKMKDSSDSDDDSIGSSDPELQKRKKKKKKKGSESEEEDEEDDDKPGSAKKRKNIRKVIKDKKLEKSTKEAAKAEEERRKRVKERQALYNEQIEEDKVTKVPITTKLVLEKDPEIQVNKTLIRKLKPHQVEAVKFLYDCTIEALERLKEGDEGSGCILAHCMGLGKTLSVITYAHTMLTYEKHTNMKTCLVVCPLNTVLNWMNEWVMWQKDMDDDDTFIVYELASVKENWKRTDYLQEWHEDGGIMIMGYEMYRNLSTLKRIKNKKMKAIFTKTLVDPGPDMVICDEGHVLKNSSTGLSQAMNQLKTKKRIVLTGTPLQNNLIEYHCMVDFVKPKLLGTKKEFCNRFVNPITNGQAADSTERDVKLMKKRAHVLHETLAGCVQRKDYTALAKFLPPKLEYVLSIRLSPVQMTLYENYLQRVGQVAGNITAKGGRLFSDYQYLMRIWTHPWVLRLNEIRAENKAANEYDSEDSFLDDNEDSEGEMSLDDNSDDEVEAKLSSEDSSSNNVGTRRTRAMRARQKKENGEEGEEIVKDWKTKSRGGDDGNDPGASTSKADVPMEEEDDGKVSSDWWSEFVSKDDQFKIELSGKLVLLSEILRMCENIGDKVLLFSQSLLSLDLVEDYLELWDSKLRSRLEEKMEASSDEEENKEDPLQSIPGSTFQGWLKGLDYFRMDGSTNAHLRRKWSETFNDPENLRARLFLISTRAGSLGTNLVGANRVIIFDASWNPSYDTQSMFRVYRFGQDKPVYIYRFVAQGTMEEKIYSRQVTKQSLSQRVVDEHQIERHFSAADLQELYNFEPDRLDDPNRQERPTPKLPTDLLLAELLTNQKEWLVNYHEHDSLLENILDEGLTEEERKAAWEEYEEEKKLGFSRAAANANMDATARFNAMTAAMMQTPRMDVLEATRAIYASNPNATPEQVRQQLAAWMQWYQRQQLEQQARMYQERMQAEQRLWQMQQQQARDRVQMAAFAQRGNETSAQALQRMAQQARNPVGGASASLHDLLTKSDKQ